MLAARNKGAASVVPEQTLHCRRGQHHPRVISLPCREILLVVREIFRADGPVGTSAHSTAVQQLSMRNGACLTAVCLAVAAAEPHFLLEMLRVPDDLEDDAVGGHSPWEQRVGGQAGSLCRTERALWIQDEGGGPALHFAAAFRCLPAVRVLFHRGAIETKKTTGACPSRLPHGRFYDPFMAPLAQGPRCKRRKSSLAAL